MCGVIISILLLVSLVVTASAQAVVTDWWLLVWLLVDYGLAIALCVMTMAKYFMR